MTHLLHIDSSPSSSDVSYSRRLAMELVATLMHKYPGAECASLDLNATPPPHIDAGLRSGWGLAPEQRSATQAASVARSEGYIAALKAADILIVAAPMHNFSIPSTLKAWIDHVCIPGQTFRYTPQGPVGMLNGKKTFLVLASGGVYSEGPAAALDHQDSYLRAVLGFIGLRDVETVRIEGVARGAEHTAGSIARAQAKIAAIGNAV
jgi:FMN-dependent NADH-azoreductase